MCATVTYSEVTIIIVKYNTHGVVCCIGDQNHCKIQYTRCCVLCVLCVVVLCCVVLCVVVLCVLCVCCVCVLCVLCSRRDGGGYGK